MRSALDWRTGCRNRIWQCLDKLLDFYICHRNRHLQGKGISEHLNCLAVLYIQLLGKNVLFTSEWVSDGVLLYTVCWNCKIVRETLVELSWHNSVMQHSPPDFSFSWTVLKTLWTGVFRRPLILEGRADVAAGVNFATLTWLFASQPRHASTAWLVLSSN